jgi:hypothetical protein
MTNHEMFAEAFKSYRGKTLTTCQIGDIVQKAFPQFSAGSMLPNDHGAGNKSDCWCAGTNNRIFDRVMRGQYRVR